jgi:NAD-dependent SIR2 family protein deacetylase
MTDKPQVNSGPRAPASTLEEFQAFLSRYGSVLVLTGAGCSTESGIPDYRGPDGVWRHRRPMLFGDFLRNEESRRHYWARSFRGWGSFAAARSNEGHRAIARYESSGRMSLLVTQNVDGLHQEGGSDRVLELHGSNRWVRCLGCADRTPREQMQQRMAVQNPGFDYDPIEIRADGDALLERELTRHFRVPECLQCGGILKPDVVFFGESVPRDRVELAMDRLRESDLLLVIGSSLAVWSGFRFARASAERPIPIAILNLGWTRADSIATLRLEAPCSVALPRVLACGERAPSS